MKDAMCPEVKVCVFSHRQFSDVVNEGMDSIGQCHRRESVSQVHQVQLRAK